MGEKLRSAFNKATIHLKPQKQGTCGLYSFWYATVLLSTFKSNLPIVYPRKGMPEAEKAGFSGESLRHFAKSNGSGQGEVFTSQQMVKIIREFKYDCVEFRNESESARKAFISEALKAERPVLVPYAMGDEKPVSKNVEDPLSHWSLIYDEDATEYVVLNPWYPNTPQHWTKQRVLKSNAYVDTHRYQKYFVKEQRNREDAETPYHERSKSSAYPGNQPPPAPQQYYDTKPDVQDLANLLIAVF